MNEQDLIRRADPYKLEKAHEGLDALVAVGCKESELKRALFRAVYFDGPGVRQVKRDDVAQFARAIRRATNLERSGMLQADTDSMGKVIGWHCQHRRTK